jgi:dCMP deaminase
MLTKFSRSEIQSLMWQAYGVAKRSPDPSSQNGALLYHLPTKRIVAEACNTFPDGVEQTEERWSNRDLKYPLVDHSEASVLWTAFRDGVFKYLDIKDMVMICPWAACSGCAGTMIGFGLKNIIAHKQAMFCNHGKWEQDCDIAMIKMKEGGVIYEMYDGYVGSDITVRRDGKPFSPDNNVKPSKPT